MNISQLITDYLAPSPQEFMQLRESIGWTNTSEAVTQKSLSSSIFQVTLRDKDKLIGAARIVGDGAMYFYIQDVIVSPDFQGLGLGHKLMQEIEDFLSKNTTPGATVGLLAAKGKEGFYKKYGYLARNGETLGLGMCRFV